MTAHVSKDQSKGDYLVCLVNAEIDRFSHNALFSREIEAALATAGWACRTIDYRKEPRKVFECLRDRHCRAFICFNGFGSELLAPTGVPGMLEPAFEQFNKPLFDLMHDCPAHESMAHQTNAIYSRRHLLITDYSYASMAKEMGVRSVTFVPSITFPACSEGLGADGPSGRDIAILFAVGLSDPELARKHLTGRSVKNRVHSVLFEEASRRAVDDWTRDPLTEIRNVAAEADVALSPKDSDSRRLITLVLDFVKFKRRRDMLSAIADLPVTVITDRDVPMGGKIRSLPSRSAAALLATMRQSAIVLCPTTHACGYHERALSAFTAGAAVVSGANPPLESTFVHGRDAMFFSNSFEMRSALESLLEDGSYREQLAQSGRERALTTLHPARLVESILTLARLAPESGPRDQQAHPSASKSA